MASTTNDFSTIERSLYVAADPRVVFDVISRPEYIVGWWSDEAEIEPTPGAVGFIAFGDAAAGGKRVEITVDEAIAPRLFAFRWAYAEGVRPGPGNSNLVTFELEPEGSGTRLKFSETGFADRGLSQTESRSMHADHSNGWDHFLPRMAGYAQNLRA